MQEPSQYPERNRLKKEMEYALKPQCARPWTSHEGEAGTLQTLITLNLVGNQLQWKKLQVLFAGPTLGPGLLQGYRQAATAPKKLANLPKELGQGLLTDHFHCA